MKRTAFLICHSDHLTSASHQVFEKLLVEEFSVKVIPHDHGIHYLEALVKIHPQAIYILWQTEFLTTWLISKGYKTATFLMYDACANAPESYFRVINDSYVFNFSRTLHKKCVNAGIVSYQLNYYPPIVNGETNKKNQLFYWLRRPNSSLSEDKIIEYFSPYVEGFHIHDKPDAYNLAQSTFRVGDHFTSTSGWFVNKQDLLDLLDQSRYYLAPRETEGIGMAFLEAMSRGCIVFANRDSTHDQYIYHGYNGFLIDFTAKDKELILKQIQEAFQIIRSGKPIGENAKKFIQKGRNIWLEQSSKILNMLTSLYDANDLQSYPKKEQILARSLVSVYYKNYKLHIFLLRILNKISIFPPLAQKKNPSKRYLVFVWRNVKKIFRK
ncbi:MAG: glycosyltransferase [Spirochaetota bacterium]